MAFQKLVNFSKTVSDLADKPALTPTALKAQFDSSPNELKDALNALIDALKLTATGDSGAKNIGATIIPGLTGIDVQSLLESLKSYSDTSFRLKTDSYTKTEVDNKIPAKGSSGTLDLLGGASEDFTITYPAGRFTDTPVLKYSIFNTDIEGAYTMASSIVANSSTGATIRLKNKGTTLQYVMVYWSAE
jgi:hypothetical protein